MVVVDIFVVIFGLIIGSFLTVCVYRIPLGRLSGIEEIEIEEAGEDLPEDLPQKNSEYFDERVTIVYPPRSFCTNCGAKLLWWHNIPVLSWILLRGKAACCKEPISWQYPTIELLTAGAAWLCYFTFPPATALLAFAITCSFIVLSFIDINYYLIPNVITYPSVVIGLVAALDQQFFGHFSSPPFVPTFLDSIYGILAGAGVLLAISTLYTLLRRKEGLGLGDVKLLAVTGVFFGPHGALFTIFAGSLLGSVVGVSLVIIGKGKWSNYLPFGPYLVVANLLFLFAAPEFLAELSGPGFRPFGFSGGQPYGG